MQACVEICSLKQRPFQGDCNSKDWWHDHVNWTVSLTCTACGPNGWLDAEANVTLAHERAMSVLTHTIQTQVLVQQTLVDIWNHHHHQIFKKMITLRKKKKRKENTQSLLVLLFCYWRCCQVGGFCAQEIIFAVPPPPQTLVHQRRQPYNCVTNIQELFPPNFCRSCSYLIITQKTQL